MIDIIKNKDLVEEVVNKGFEKALLIGEDSENDIILIRARERSELRNKIMNARKTGKAIAVLGDNDDVNRFAIESKINIFLSPEFTRKTDFPDYRNSGLNQVTCKKARENNTAIAFNFSDILNLEGEARASRLGRMMQNVKLCRKFKVKMILATFANEKSELRTPKELMDFGISIGMTADDARKALEWTK